MKYRFHPKALEVYASAGWKLYPCTPGQKKPLIDNYYERATNDMNQLLAWREQWPDANFAAVTGQASGIVALDIDAPYGLPALRALEEAFVPLDMDSLIQATPNGGWHVIFKAPEQPLPSRPKLLGWGVELRAEKASIMLAPSVVDDSEYKTYAWTLHDVERYIFNPQPLPQWIVDLVRHAEATKPAVGTLKASREASINGLVSWLSNQVEGNRNAALYWCAKRMCEGGLPISDAMLYLGVAARKTGLQDKEIERTIRSAYK